MCLYGHANKARCWLFLGGNDVDWEETILG